MGRHAVEVDRVSLSYGSTRALHQVDLRVPYGHTIGVLGHNGAGKTSLIRVLTTAARPERGRVLIAGIDARRDPAEVRRRIGVTGQYAGLDDFLTTVENLELMARLAGLRAGTRRRVLDLVDRFDLRHVAARRVGELSGGLRRRVDLAASLVASPTVLFLDEPTTGLDPSARHRVWEVITELTATGTTVVLTTQYLEEADRLADQLVVLDHGRVVAGGTAGELKRMVGGKIVRATLPRDRLAGLARRPDSASSEPASRVSVSYAVADDGAAADLITDLHTTGSGLADLEVASPSLDDVFFHLTRSGAAA